jgi:hypothetical protein
LILFLDLFLRAEIIFTSQVIHKIYLGSQHLLFLELFQKIKFVETFILILYYKKHISFRILPNKV